MSTRNIVLVVVSFALTVIVIAQDDNCPAFVQTALDTVGEVCADIGRNLACYGNGEIIALDFESVELLDFNMAGDTEEVFNIRSISTSAMDVDNEVWGIVLMTLQANLPDTVPGQNVTFVIFGDTQLVNQVSPDTEVDLPTLSATINNGINVRAGASTDFAIVGSLSAKDEVTLVGRNSASDWVQISLADGIGWLYVPLITVDGDVSTLNVVESSDANDPRYTMPMQAFRLETGIGAPECQEAPRDGILVQAPTNTVVNFRINEIDVVVGSTAMLQVDDDGLRVNTLDGTVNVTSNGQTQTVEPGFGVDVIANTPPSQPELYDYGDIRNAPVNLLPESIRIPFVIPGNVGSGQWVDSGVRLTAGQEYTVEATGQVNIWPQCSQICTGENIDSGLAFIPSCEALCTAVMTSPAGSVSIESVAQGVSSFYPMPNEPMGALLGRIGTGDAFYVGLGDTFVADTDGSLQFRINEDTRVPGDETGRFTVFIET